MTPRSDNNTQNTTGLASSWGFGSCAVAVGGYIAQSYSTALGNIAAQQFANHTSSSVFGRFIAYRTFHAACSPYYAPVAYCAGAAVAVTVIAIAERKVVPAIRAATNFVYTNALNQHRSSHWTRMASSVAPYYEQDIPNADISPMLGAFKVKAKPVLSESIAENEIAELEQQDFEVYREHSNFEIVEPLRKVVEDASKDYQPKSIGKLIEESDEFLNNALKEPMIDDFVDVDKLAPPAPTLESAVDQSLLTSELERLESGMLKKECLEELVKEMAPKKEILDNFSETPILEKEIDQELLDEALEDTIFN